VTSAGSAQAVFCRLTRHPHSHSKRGIALVITLILLSVTLVMALAFLPSAAAKQFLTRRARPPRAPRRRFRLQRRGAGHGGVLATTNPATIRPARLDKLHKRNGFDSAITTNDPNNVNYDY